MLRDIAGQQVEVELVGYGPDDTLGTYDGELTIERMDEHDDLKFVGSSWLEVFDTYVVSDITDRLQVDTRVVHINATGDQAVVTDQRGGSFEADAVIVTVPVTILRDPDTLRARVLAELDEVFDGAASRSYRRHLVQDWSVQAHIRQAYVADHADWRHVRRLGQPAGDRVLFAGDAYTDGENGSEVHVAANSARVAVERLLGSW